MNQHNQKKGIGLEMFKRTHVFFSLYVASFSVYSMAVSASTRTNYVSQPSGFIQVFISASLRLLCYMYMLRCSASLLFSALVVRTYTCYFFLSSSQPHQRFSVLLLD